MKRARQVRVSDYDAAVCARAFWRGEAGIDAEIGGALVGAAIKGMIRLGAPMSGKKPSSR